MSGVPEIDPALISTLIATILETDYALTSPQLLFGEVANILVSFLWSDARLTVVASLPAERLEADNHGVEILPLPEVNSLEGLLRWDAERSRRFEERVYILHAFERKRGLVHFLHGTLLDFVHQFAKEDAILQGLKEVVHVPVGIYVFAGDRLDPFQTFLG